MKTITVNGTEVVCQHEVKTDKNQSAIHLTVKAGDIETTHVMTIGPVDQPLPENYGADDLQKDFDAFRQKHAELAESKHRAKTLAAAIS